MQHGAQTYGKVANQTVSQRELEASLLLKAASRLQAVHDGWDRKQDELSDALLYNRRLWTIFIEDLSHPDNGLPDQLRADIISIGLWVIKEADRLREKKSGDVVRLIEINRVIRDALQ